MRLNNPKQIRAEDFSDELQEDMAVLGGILNPFMQEVFELSDGRIGFENLSFILKKIDVEVDANGVPKVVDKINTGKEKVNAIIVVRAVSLFSAEVYPTGQPWVNYTEKGNKVVDIVNITGLPADNKFRLTLFII